MTIVFEEKVPNPNEFCDMRVRANLSPKSLEAATIALPNSLYGVSIRDEGVLIGMGRVVAHVILRLSTLLLILVIKDKGLGEK